MTDLNFYHASVTHPQSHLCGVQRGVAGDVRAGRPRHHDRSAVPYRRAAGGIEAASGAKARRNGWPFGRKNGTAADRAGGLAA